MQWLKSLAERLGGRCLDPAKPGLAVGAIDVHAIEEQHVKMNIEIQRTVKALDQGDRTRNGRCVGIPRFLDPMRGNGAADGAPHQVRDLGSGAGNGSISTVTPGTSCQVSLRYADDFVVMCRKDVEEPLKVVRHVLELLGLSLNEAKTHTVNATKASFNFLGFTLRMSQGIRTGKSYPHVCPADKSLKKIKAKLTAMTGRELTPIPLETIVGNLNRSLRGWVSYFHYRNSNQVMEKVKTHAEQRMRKHLMKRHKVKDRGIGEGRFPSVELYRRYGLYKVPTAAGWKSAHASV